MAHAAEGKAAQIAFSIVGFGCNQAFLFLMLFLGPNSGLSFFGLSVEMADQLLLLLFMVVAFAVYPRVFSQGDGLLRHHKLVAFMVVLMVGGAALGGFVHSAFGGASLLAIPCSVAMAVPCAWFLCAWGGLMSHEPISRFVPEVFLGSAFAAALCLAASVLSGYGATLVMVLVAAGNGFYLAKLKGASDAELFLEPTDAPGADPDAMKLGVRLLVGTAAYGLSMGAVQGFAVRATSEASFAMTHAMPGLPVCFLVFVLFCLGVLQLFGRNPLFSGVSILPKVDHSPVRENEGPLDGAYRLAVAVMMAGFFAIPVLFGTSVPGEAVVLAGYLAVETVFLSLFMVMGSLYRGHAAPAVARGFLFLFLGQAVGLVVSLLFRSQFPDITAAYGVAALAGVLALCAYLFLFTDRDLRSLSAVVSRKDGFDRRVERMISAYGLSKRESEILPYVLKGRTGERIAAELYISKNTVDTHIRRIYAKCEVHNRQQLIDLSETLES